MARSVLYGAFVSNKILLIESEPEMSLPVSEALGRRGFDVTVSWPAEEAFQVALNSSFDAVIADVNSAATNGLDLCRRLSASRPDVPVVVVSALGTMEMAVGAMRAGAYDFLSKPVDMDQLSLTLGRAIQVRALRSEVKRLREQITAPRAFGEIVGESQPMERVFRLLERVSDSEATVLVTGESGTGKELVARALHQRSRRSAGPFVAINCAALTETILESELFGHVRGAFTDAKVSKPGLLVAASGGTLFLDEIGEMSPSTQVKLLRALQERTVRPIGGDHEIPFDARIVAATNLDLEAEVAERRFREDLYYRVNVVRVRVPALRERGNDILLMAQLFLERFAQRSGKAIRGISSQAAEKLLGYEWPGNVRELQNCIERAVALTRFEEIAVDDLPSKIRDYRVTDLALPTEDSAALLSLDQLEHRYVLHVLRTMNGNKTIAAQVLGLDRRTLHRRLQRYRQRPETSLDEASN